MHETHYQDVNHVVALYGSFCRSVVTLCFSPQLPGVTNLINRLLDKISDHMRICIEQNKLDDDAIEFMGNIQSYLGKLEEKIGINQKKALILSATLYWIPKCIRPSTSTILDHTVDIKTRKDISLALLNIIEILLTSHLKTLPQANNPSEHALDQSNTKRAIKQLNTLIQVINRLPVDKKSRITFWSRHPRPDVKSLKMRETPRADCFDEGAPSIQDLSDKNLCKIVEEQLNALNQTASSLVAATAHNTITRRM